MIFSLLPIHCENSTTYQLHSTPLHFTMKPITLLPTALLLTTAHSLSPSTPETDPPPPASLWTSTWTPTSLSPYTLHCHTTTTHTTPIYSLSALYPDLAAAAPQLKVFFNKQVYAGSWDGIDVHGGGRELIAMAWPRVPRAVRRWIERNKEQKQFSVQDGQVYFAPGAMYPMLPLWADGGEWEGEERGECEGKFGFALRGSLGALVNSLGLICVFVCVCVGVFEDLDRYANEPRDGAVIAKVVHAKTGAKEVTFTVEAMLVKKKKKEKGEEEEEEVEKEERDEL